MKVTEPTNLITGKEFGEERRRLILAGHRHDSSSELKMLWERVRERDDYLWDRYAKPLISKHPGKWAAVDLNGQVLLADTASEAIHEGARRFGDANFVYGKVAEFRGHDV